MIKMEKLIPAQCVVMFNLVGDINCLTPVSDGSYPHMITDFANV